MTAECKQHLRESCHFDLLGDASFVPFSRHSFWVSRIRYQILICTDFTCEMLAAI